MQAMETEAAVDYAAPGMFGHVDVGVDEDETIADVLVEDDEQSITLRLSADELISLIASLQRALVTVRANS